MHDLKSFFVLFDDTHPVEYHSVEKEMIPSSYHELLVHNNHMTSTLENFYQKTLQITVHKQTFIDNVYRRCSFLWLEPEGVVQIGIILMDMSSFDENIKKDILLGKTPLGKILIDYDEPRNIHVNGFIKVKSSPSLQNAFSITDSVEYCYGRMTTIVCKTTIQVVEIIRP